MHLEVLLSHHPIINKRASLAAPLGLSEKEQFDQRWWGNYIPSKCGFVDKQMIRSAGNIWPAQDALVYDSLDGGQRRCPLGPSSTFSAAVQHRAEQRVAKDCNCSAKSASFSHFVNLTPDLRATGKSPRRPFTCNTRETPAPSDTHSYHVSKSPYASHVIKN